MFEEDNRLKKLEAKISIYSDRTACKSTNNLQLGSIFEFEGENSLLYEVPSDEDDYYSSRRGISSKEGTLQTNPGIPESTSQLLTRQIESTKQKIKESQDLIMKREINNLELKIKITQLQDLAHTEQINGLCNCLIL